VADATDAHGKRFVSNLPLLLIDDEADHASVDTGEQLIGADGKPDEDHEPKAINSRIRKILNTFSKKAYVGYTATPFANIFIHRQNETPEEGPDLFPQSFIINLAAPSNYVGPARVFGLQTPEGRSGLPLTRVFQDHTSEDGKDGWMPPSIKKITLRRTWAKTCCPRRCVKQPNHLSWPAPRGRSAAKGLSIRRCLSTSPASRWFKRKCTARSKTSSRR